MGLVSPLQDTLLTLINYFVLQIPHITIKIYLNQISIYKRHFLLYTFNGLKPNWSINKLMPLIYSFLKSDAILFISKEQWVVTSIM